MFFFYYLEVSDSTVSVVVVKENERIQHPVYFSSQTLHDAKTKYIKVGKVPLTLVSASRNLKSYFKAHQVIVLSDKPLR
jgi:hypothetical protein